jgi:WD40 repeat protein
VLLAWLLTHLCVARMPIIPGNIKSGCVGVMRGHTDRLCCMQEDPRENLLVTGSRDSTIRYATHKTRTQHAHNTHTTRTRTHARTHTHTQAFGADVLT